MDFDNATVAVSRSKKLTQRRLSDFARPFLTKTPYERANYSGSFTNVMMAKVFDILSRRGLMEQAEENRTELKRLSAILMACPARDASGRLL